MKITVTFASCSLESQAQGEVSCHVMRTRKQPCEGIHLCRNWGPLPTISTNLSSTWICHFEIDLPSIFTQDFKVCTLELSKLFYWKIHICASIYLSNTFHLFLKRHCCLITLGLPPKKRWRIRVFSHVRSHWLVVIANIVCKPLRLFPEIMDLSLYPPIMLAREMEAVVIARELYIYHLWFMYSDSCFSSLYPQLGARRPISTT